MNRQSPGSIVTLKYSTSFKLGYLTKSTLKKVTAIVNPLRPRQNFSLQYQYNIKQTSDENQEKHQLGDS